MENKGPNPAVRFGFHPLALQILTHTVFKEQSRASPRGVRRFASRSTASRGSVGTRTKVLNPDQHLLPVTPFQPQKQLCLCRGRGTRLLSVLPGYDPGACKPGLPPAMAWLALVTRPAPPPILFHDLPTNSSHALTKTSQFYLTALETHPCPVTVI